MIKLIIVLIKLYKNIYGTFRFSYFLSVIFSYGKIKKNLMIPRVKTEIARGSFYYSGAKMYSNLPNKIKTSLSMSALKEYCFK